ncbi:MAG: hypothetical protein KF678_09680 [Phycisphaeraceae bacterium]|nr:hypothetical protein [Phycisphaeraceae bacterium]
MLNARSLAGLALGMSAGVAGAQCVPQWIPMPAGQWLDDEVKSMTVWTPSPSAAPLLIAGGNFFHGGGTPMNLIGAWNGSQWWAMGAGLPGSGMCLLTVDPDGAGPQPEVCYSGAVGSSPAPTPARWIGSMWEVVGGGIVAPASPTVETMAWFDSSLFIGGIFSSVGGQPIASCARWDGVMWHAPDPRWQSSSYRSLFNHGGQLFAGGGFFFNGALPQRGVLRWTGSQFEPVPGAPSNNVIALSSYRGRLIAGGAFSSIWTPGQPGEHIAAWDGTSWGPLGAGVSGTICALTTFDPDGPGPLPEYLIAGGLFSFAGGVPASRIAAWDGTSWTALGSGVNGEVLSLCVYQNQLYVGGYFTLAGGQASPFLARWGCITPPPPPCYANCDQSTGSPSLTANDFMCFLNAYARGDSSANCDGSTGLPTLTANDFACFINKYAAGCS